MNSSMPVVFSDAHFGSVRVITKKGEPWFVAKDVCDCLGLSNPWTSLALLDADEKDLHSVETLGGFQETSIISEPGLYSLILRSRKPEAKAFKRWITHEVIPAIRRTGTYTNQNIALPDFTDPAAAAIAWAEQYKAKAKAQQQLALAAPKAKVYDAVVADRRLTLNTFCRRLRGVNLIKVKESLLNSDVLYRTVNGTYRVYAKYRNTHFEEKFDASTGRCSILVLEEGQKLLTKLYNKGLLIMKQGYDHHGSGTSEA